MQEALRYAYNMEARRVWPRPLLERISRATSGLTAYERIADGILIKNRAQRVLEDSALRHVVGLAYRRRVDAGLEELHDYDIYVCHHYARKENDKLRNKHMVREAMLQWADYPTPHKNLARWWANHLNMRESAVKHLIYSKEPGRRSIYHILDSWLAHAETIIAVHFAQDNIVP